MPTSVRRSHARKLAELHGCHVSRETLRRWMIEDAFGFRELVWDHALSALGDPAPGAVWRFGRMIDFWKKGCGPRRGCTRAGRPRFLRSGAPQSRVCRLQGDATDVTVTRPVLESFTPSTHLAAPG